MSSRKCANIMVMLINLYGIVTCDYTREEFLVDNYHNGQEYADAFTNEWTVRILGGENVAQLLAWEMGFQYGGKINADEEIDKTQGKYVLVDVIYSDFREAFDRVDNDIVFRRLVTIPVFEDTYLFTKEDHKIDRRTGQDLKNQNHISMIYDHRVTWAEQLFSKRREKRDFLYDPNKPKPLKISKYNNYNPTDEQNLYNMKISKRDEVQVPRQSTMLFNDILWSQEWYLHDTRTRADLPRLDLNVLPVYKMGITGKGVKVTILDDGLEHSHEDLKINYEASISWDSNGGDADPTPRYDAQRHNGHGTRCAGEIAMVANNGKCGVGVAFNAKVGGVRLLDGQVNDKVEGEALGFANDKVDIYSASWGPKDDGRTVEGPGRLAQAALERGVNEGRNGKGAIFVWASGNGGSRFDNCNCDGYTGSIYTVSIGSASQRGTFPWYGEICASTLAVTYSSGAYEDQMIATTDLMNSCTVKHTGTSASAPLAAGILALALEANPNLTWRDIQHLITWTSEYAPVADNLGWQINRAGFRFDIKFGFGLMNAHGLVSAAQNWTTVPKKSVCVVKAEMPTNLSISHGTPVTLRLPSTGCSGTKDEVNFLEHVELNVNILYTVRGALEIYLTSPGGTRIQLLSPRKFDQSNKGFINWRLMSVGTWGEKSEGNWLAEIYDQSGLLDNHGYLGPFSLYLHGSKTRPEYMSNGPRKYDYDYNIKQVLEDIDQISDQIENVPRYESLPITHKPAELQKITDNEIILKNDYRIEDEDGNEELDSDNLYQIGDSFAEYNKKKRPEDYTDIVDNIIANNVVYPTDKIYNYLNTLKQYDEDKLVNRVHHQLTRLLEP